MKTAVLHEVLHLIYFKKLTQVFPYIPKSKYSGPGLVWELSEMMPSVVLGDQRIQRIHRHEPVVYQEYKTLEIDGKPILDYLQEFYGDRKTFDDFLRKSWDFICKYGLGIKEKLGRK